MSDLKGARVLVTGGLGFLGLNLVPMLERAGTALRILNRSLDPLACAWLEEVRNGHRPDVVQGDIADAAGMRRWLDGVDLVVNLAGESGAVKSLREAQTDMHVNVGGHLNLLDALREMPVPPRTVFVSSRLVYGVTRQDRVDEEHAQRPTSLYGLHKLTVEHYYRIYHENYGIPFTTLRLTNPYGPFQLPHRTQYGIVNRFVMGALGGRTLHLFGGGTQLRDYVHAEDVGDAVLRALADPAAVGETYNVGAGHSVSLREVAQRIVELCGSGAIEDVPWPEGYRQVETGDFLCDTTKIQRQLGWMPKIELEAGLRDTVARYRALLR